jgi:S1-C subfamily serine protease
MQKSGRNMRHLWFLVLMALTPAAWGADWKPLPSTAAYQSQVDLDSVGMYGVFLLNRAYVRPQALTGGKIYSSMRSQYYVLCNEGKVSLETALYFGEGGKLTHIDFRRDWKLKFAAPDNGSDLAAAMTQVCGRLAGSTDSGAAPAVKKAVPARPTISTGSGIVITPNGLILTNEHVVRQCDSLQVVLDSIRTVKATLRAAICRRISISRSAAMSCDHSSKLNMSLSQLRPFPPSWRIPKSHSPLQHPRHPDFKSRC